MSRLALLTAASLLSSHAAVATPRDTGDAQDPPAESDRAAPRRLQTVRVRAPRLPPGEAEFETGGAAAVVEGRSLQRTGRELQGVLSRQVGIGVQRIGGFGSQAAVRLRASSPEQVLWAIDDVPLQAIDGGTFDLGALPLSQLQRVEIYRGATPWQLGGQAIGGAIRLVLRRPEGLRASGALGAGSHGASLVEGSGSWDALGGGLAAVRWLGSRGDWGYTWDGGTAFDPRDDRRRRRRNNDVRRLSFMLRQALPAPAAWDLRLRVLGHRREQGLPGAALFEARDARLRAQGHDAVLVGRRKGLVARRDRLVAQLHLGWEGSDVEDDRGELGPPRRARQRTRGIEGSVRWTSEPLGPARPALRLAARLGEVRRWDALSGRRTPPADRRALELGLGVPLTWAGGALALLPSLDLAWAASRRSAAIVEGRWRDLDAPARLLPTWRLALRWQPHETLGLQAGWTRAARTPSLAELFGNDGTISGRPGLRDERSETIDAGLDWSGRRGGVELGATLGVFAAGVQDLIGLRRVQVHLARYENIAAARLLGAELGARLAWGRRLALRAWYGTTASRDASQSDIYRGKALPMRPRTHLGVHAEVRGHPAPRLGRVALWGGWRWQAGHYTDRSNLVAVPPRGALDLGCEMGSRDGRVQIQARVDNLLDRENFDLVGFPLPGRTLMVTLSLRTRGEP